MAQKHVAFAPASQKQLGARLRSPLLQRGTMPAQPFSRFFHHTAFAKLGTENGAWPHFLLEISALFHQGIGKLNSSNGLERNSRNRLRKTNDLSIVGEIEKHFTIQPHSLTTFNWMIEVPQSVSTYKVCVAAVTDKLSAWALEQSP